METQRINNNNPHFGMKLATNWCFDEAVVKHRIEKPILEEVIPRVIREFANSDSEIMLHSPNRWKSLETNKREGIAPLELSNQYGHKKRYLRFTPKSIYKALASFIKMTDEYKPLREYVYELNGKYGLDMGLNGNYYPNRIGLREYKKTKKIYDKAAKIQSASKAKDDFRFWIHYDYTRREKSKWTINLINIDNDRRTKLSKRFFKTELFCILKYQEMKKFIGNHIDGIKDALEKSKTKKNDKIAALTSDFGKKSDKLIKAESSETAKTAEIIQEAGVPSEKVGTVIREALDSKQRFSHEEIRAGFLGLPLTTEKEFAKLEAKG